MSGKEVVVRVRKTRGGRLRISELHLQNPTPVGLRELRLGAVEKLVNLPHVRDVVLLQMGDEPPADVFGSWTIRGEVRIRPRSGKLERPGRKINDEFLRRVIAERDAAIERGDPIINALAESSGAPRDTVARWLKAARRLELADRGGRNAS